MPTAAPLRKPEWLKIRPPSGENFLALQSLFRARNLHTVCEEARCPNISECWGGGTATLMLLGDTCTRACRFCAVATGNPRGAVDEQEPRKVGEAIGRMGLTYVVLTTVNRDDLPDGGAAHIAETIHWIKQTDPELLVEILMGDFQGDRNALETVASSGADVLAHNLETVERLTPQVRDRRASYAQSLAVLKHLKALAPHLHTKSSLMLGLGESDAEIRQAIRDLREAGVDFLTLGQYLQPTKSPRHLPVLEYVSPARFEAWRLEGEAAGFQSVASGPLVRSSYKAGEFFIQSLIRKERNAAS